MKVVNDNIIAGSACVYVYGGVPVLEHAWHNLLIVEERTNPFTIVTLKRLDNSRIRIIFFKIYFVYATIYFSGSRIIHNLN